MNCKDATLLLHAYLDHELEPSLVGELELHLEGCPACAAQLAAFESLRTTLRRDAPRHAAPAALRERLMAIRSLGPGNSAVALGSAGIRRHWAIAACILLSLALGAGGMYGFDRFSTARAAADSFAANLVSSHLRALTAVSAVDVLSSDRHTVKPWFAGRVDQSPPVIDLADEGFPLVGGRVDYIGERRLPVVVYRRAQHLIDVYWLAAAPPDGAARATERRGFHLVRGSRDDQWAWIVSDLDPAELTRFAGLLRSKVSISR